MTTRLRVTKTHRAFRRWRIYPEPGRAGFFWIYLCRDRQTFLRVLKDTSIIDPFPAGRSINGLCQTWRHLRSRDGRWRAAPDLGAIIVHLGRIGAGVAAHELMHATIGWARRKRLNPRAVFDLRGRPAESTTNERLCSANEHLTRQFWNGFYRVTRRVA